MSKQSIAFLKTQNFLQAYPIIWFFQHNNLSVKEWLDLRIQLKNLQVDKATDQPTNLADILVLKNTLIENLLIQEKLSNIHHFTSLFQGPCFALGFSNSSQISDILKITKQTTSIFLLGGIYNNQFVNHLDIFKILQLDEKVHEVLITNLNKSTELHSVLSTPIQNSCMQLDQVAQNLLHCLHVLKLKHKVVFIVYM
jgi:ribosomal protein L10